MLKRVLAQLLYCPPWPPAPPPAPKAMARAVAFKRGDKVQRRNHTDGRPPAYRFRGTVCGEYDNPATGERGYNVSLAHDPGCIQNFPGYMLEPWSGDDGLSPWQGWDKGRDGWAETKHKDRVCAAVFGPAWSVEDAAMLIGFIETTWSDSTKADGP